MATFLLVPGAWLGGWCWKYVALDLRAAGHTVIPATLTGLGERAHLLSGQIDLGTHVTDIVAYSSTATCTMSSWSATATAARS